MKHKISLSLLALLALPVSSRGQDTSKPLPDAPSYTTAEKAGQQSVSTSSSVQPTPTASSLRPHSRRD